MKCQGCGSDVFFFPFQKRIAPKTCSFELELPASALTRCYFHKLSLTPSYYSQLAHKLRLDPDPEQAAPAVKFLSLSARYDSKNPPVATLNVSDRKTSTFCRDLNEVAEKFRPAHMPMAPVFMDWLIVGADELPVSNNMNRHIEDNFEAIYGQVDQEVYHNVLPVSVRDFSWANNYLLPDEFWKKPEIRLRLNVAPNTKVTIFGTSATLISMGFNPGEFVDRGKGSSVENERKLSYTSVVAPKPSREEFITAVPKSWKVQVHQLDFDSPDMPLNVSPDMLESLELLVDEINVGLRSIAARTNFKLRLSYEPSELRYLFSFPDDGKTQANVKLPLEVAEALGYSEDVVARGVKPRVVHAQDDRHNALVKSRALAYDTGQIMCCQKYVSSSTLRGAGESMVALLKPDTHGRLELTELPCVPSIKSLGQHGSELSGQSTVAFELIYVDEDDKVKPLSWPCGAYAEGLLVGLKCGCL